MAMRGVQVLLTLLICWAHRGWSFPGKIESASSSSTTFRTSLSNRTPSTRHLVKIVFETVCNDTSATPKSSTIYSASTRSTTSSLASSTSEHGFTNSSTGPIITSSSSNAQSALHYTSSIITTSSTSKAQHSSIKSSEAQSAPSNLISGISVSPHVSSGTPLASVGISSATSTVSLVPSRSSTATSAVVAISRSTSSHGGISSSKSMRSTARTIWSGNSTQASRSSKPSGISAVSSTTSVFHVPSTTVSNNTSTTTSSITRLNSTSRSTLSTIPPSIISKSISTISKPSLSANSTSQSNSSTLAISTQTSSRSIPHASMTMTLNATSISINSSVPLASKAPILSATRASVVSSATGASASRIAASILAKPVDCNDGTWDLTIANYNKFNTDANLKTWWNGGMDNETFMTFPAKQAPGTFLTEALAATFEPVGEQFVCTLEQHSCQPADGCNNYAVHIPAGVAQTGVAQYYKEVGPASHYGWFGIHSIANIYSFSETFSSGLVSAGIQIASENMQLTTTFTKPADQAIKTRSILLGFAFLVAAIFAFVPVVGELAGAAVIAGAVGAAAGVISTSLGTTAAFIGISLANGASLDTKASTFGAYMGMIFNSTAGALDLLVAQLMNGLPINATPGSTDPTIFGLIEGGKWINSSIDTNPNLSIAAMTEIMRDDLIQRGINYIWGQSKIWVTFANLEDDAAGTKCLADKNGWQASKTCADGGVYYLYRFNEDGHYRGHLDYPWGADKMTDKPFAIQPSWVTKSSAASYRAQNNGIGGFNYDQTTPPANLTDALTEVANTGTLDSLRTLPGVWNLSVCDMGTHNDWNADFTQKPMVTENQDGLSFFFPCCCGPQCSQTHDFIAASQMENFQTIVRSCRTQLRRCSAWPPGVTEIDYGGAGKINNRSCVKGDASPDLDDFDSPVE